MGIFGRLFLIGTGFYGGLFLRDIEGPKNRKVVEAAQQVCGSIKDFIHTVAK